VNREYYENQVVQACSEYAGIAHIGQFRKNGITPYVTHPARVAALVSSFLKRHKDLFIYLSAAWLHDVMEDCSIITDGEFSNTIKNHTGEDADIYHFLTNNDTINIDDGQRIYENTLALTMSQNKSVSKKERKQVYYDSMRAVDPGVIVIKYCDRIDNLITVHHFSQSGFKWYIQETESMMSQLSRPKNIEEYTGIMLDAHRLALATVRSHLDEVKRRYKVMYK